MIYGTTPQRTLYLFLNMNFEGMMMMVMMMMVMMMMMMLASVPSDLHAHPPCKVYPGAEERAR